MSKGLKPCPFCGRIDSEDNPTQSSAIHATIFRSPLGKRAYRVECCCGASGSASLDILEAVNAWNLRAPPSEVSP